MARALYGLVGQQIDRAASGVMQALGYYGARHDTYYPTSYLGGNSGQLVNIDQGTPREFGTLGIDWHLQLFGGCRG